MISPAHSAIWLALVILILISGDAFHLPGSYPHKYLIGDPLYTDQSHRNHRSITKAAVERKQRRPLCPTPLPSLPADGDRWNRHLISDDPLPIDVLHPLTPIGSQSYCRWPRDKEFSKLQGE